MQFRTGRLLPALCILLGGCASIPQSVLELEPDAAAVELTDTPFFAQERYQCGPAALATVLEFSGASVDVDDLIQSVYVPGRQGSFQVELLAATRMSGRLPYVIDGTLASLYKELSAGRPVLVLQNLGVQAIPRWHYAVVVGIDPIAEEITLRSGADRRRITPTKTFLHTRRRGGYWGMVALPPNELPAGVDRVRYFTAIAALEQTGRLSEAAAAWQTALNAWPGDRTATFGLANARSAAGELTGAEVLYRDLLAAERDPAVRNNLALVLARQGRIDEALQEIDRARAAAGDTALAAEIDTSRREILAMRSGSR